MRSLKKISGELEKAEQLTSSTNRRLKSMVFDLAEFSATPSMLPLFPKLSCTFEEHVSKKTCQAYINLFSIKNTCESYLLVGQCLCQKKKLGVS